MWVKHSRACSNPVRMRLYSLHLHSQALSCFSLSDVSRLRLSLITCVESSLARLWASCTSAERCSSRLSWLTTEKEMTSESKHWSGFQWDIFSASNSSLISPLCLLIMFSLVCLIYFLFFYRHKHQPFDLLFYDCYKVLTISKLQNYSLYQQLDKFVFFSCGDSAKKSHLIC